LKGNQDLTLNNSFALSIGKNGQSTEYSGDLSGSGSIKKIGTGTLTLSGALSYSGTTTIDGGTLSICTPVSVQANVLLHDIVGTGDLIVGDGVNPTNLTATSIRVNSLSIGGSSGGMAAVPEPSTLVLLLVALAASVYPLRKRIVR
jgi:autotransporter-associated beta strand protein